MKRASIAFAALLLSHTSAAADLSAVAGHYRYEQYVVTLPNERELHLKDIGATEAFLDVSDAGITLRMTMLGGNTVVQTAKVLQAYVARGAGFWIAQWPDMKGPVRATIRLDGNELTSDTKFDNPADAQFGSSEHAVLRRVGVTQRR